MAERVQRTNLTEEFTGAVELYRVTQGLLWPEYQETTHINQRSLKDVLRGKVRSIKPEWVGKMVKGLGISRSEEAYLYSLVGIQLPLFPETSMVWDGKTGSVGSRIDQWIIDFGLNRQQRQAFADIILPNALALIRLIRINVQPVGPPLTI